MTYKNVKKGEFIVRENRFVGKVLIDGKEEICHIKNTGRCKELLKKGAAVYLTESENSSRKTKYDLIAVEKGERLINIDSQAPNIAALEFLPKLFRLQRQYLQILSKYHSPKPARPAYFFGRF